jgi:hypothetical protein
LFLRRNRSIVNVRRALMVDYGLPGVIWPMIALLVVQIIAVYFWGVEPARQPFEWLDPRSQTPPAL